MLLLNLLTLLKSTLLINVASSAYNKKLNPLLAFGKSFINIKNNKGPKIEPCGTPQLISTVEEFDELMDTYCFLLLR
jgi:hypothetical protein